MASTAERTECVTGARCYLHPQQHRQGLQYSNGYSALFVLYEYMLSRNDGETSFDRHLVLRSIEETARGALTFAEAAYRDQDGNYPPEIFSPYLPYSLCQAAIVHHRLWTQTGHVVYKQGLDTLKAIIRNMTKRWMVACKCA